MQEGSRKRTAVFICELRDDLGFAAPLLCVADELVKLARDRCELQTIFILSDPIYCGDEIAVHGHMVLPAPSIRHLLDINSLAGSYANLLASIGFAHEPELTRLLHAWDRLFALVSPNLVVADNSPSACMAARGRIPVVLTGSGFSAPPSNISLFPALATDVQSETNQILIHDIVNKVLCDRGVPRLNNLSELFAGELRAVFTVPPLDPYRAHRDEKLFSPCVDIRGPLAPCNAPSIFFALPSTFPNLTGIVRAVTEVGAFISCYVPGPRTVGLTLLEEIGARVFERRPVPHDVLSDAAVVLAASPDLALLGYLAGRPQLVLRTDLEMRAMASELERRRTAISLEVGDLDRFGYSLRELLHNPSYAQSAQEESRRLQTAVDFDNSAGSIARQCLELVTSSHAMQPAKRT